MKEIREDSPVVAVCPKCSGMKKVEEKTCNICDGTGVIWKSDSPKVGDKFTKVA